METKKRIYVSLLAASLLFMALTVALVWYLLSHRDVIISQIVLISIAVLAGMIFVMLGMGILAIVIMIIRSKTTPSLETITQRANEVLFPLAIFIGKIMGIDREKVLKSYISVNNYLVKNKMLSVPGSQVMILLPHCLQNSECKVKITMDINNCKQCGKCKVGELKELAERYHANLRVATGGTLARKWIKELRPRAVVAVACERDLSSGIQDTAALPVLGILNCRPNGPCIDTDVNIEEIEKALVSLCGGG